jgi:hypothetical protein
VGKLKSLVSFERGEEQYMHIYNDQLQHRRKNTEGGTVKYYSKKKKNGRTVVIQ